MTAILLAEFPHAHALTEAARAAKGNGHRVIDAFTPFPVDGLADLIDAPTSKVRVFMFIGGILIATMAYGGEYYTAVINYPYNSGGRPLNAWPAFMLVPFATGILGASVAGFIRLLFETGLPRLNFPLFEVDGFQRASQDQFLLAVASPESKSERRDGIDWLRRAGALSVREVEW